MTRVSFLVSDTHWCAGRVMGPEGNGSFALGPTQLWPYMSLHLPDPDLYLLHITVTINIVLF